LLSLLSFSFSFGFFSALAFFSAASNFLMLAFCGYDVFAKLVNFFFA
jgi:hypothetical protein